MCHEKRNILYLHLERNIYIFIPGEADNTTFLIGHSERKWVSFELLDKTNLTNSKVTVPVTGHVPVPSHFNTF